MSSDIYIPDLDDADFRRLIDARKLVVIKFWAPLTNDKISDTVFYDAARRHPEVAFAQSNVDEHHGLMSRTQVSTTPTLQGWVNGTMVANLAGEFDGGTVDDLIRDMILHLPPSLVP